MNLGLVLVQLNDAAGAKVQLEKAIELGVREPQARFELAKVLRTLGETEEAQKQLELFQQKLKDDADQSLAVMKATQAEEAIKDGEKTKAANLYREACAAQPEDAALAYRWSLVLSDLGDTAGERAALEQAIKANPKFVQAQYALGYLEFHAGENAAAEQQFRITVKAAPDSARAWLSLAAALAAEGRIQEAQEAVASALKLDPTNAGARELSKKLAETSGQR
jgi:tetratricopeptide (TPR) repeat protein